MDLRKYLRDYLTPKYYRQDGCYSAPCPVCGRLSLLADISGHCFRQDCPCDLSYYAGYSPPAVLECRPATAQASEEGKPRLLQVGDFLQAVGPPPPMLVEELIPDYSLIALTGKPKFAKSLCALDLLEAVCEGRPVFEAFRVNRCGPVVYLGMEDGQYEIANRLLQRGMRAGDRRAFHLCTARFPMGRSESIPDLERLIQPVHPALMVIDTAREALGISDWCNPAEVVEKIRPLREFARAHCSILLIAHNRKAEGEGGDEISGTNAFTSSIDGWLSCFKREVLANGNLRLSIRREGRCGMRGEFVVEMDTRTLRFTALTEEQLSEARPDAHQERYLSVLHLMAQNDNRATAIMISERLEIDLRLAQRVLKEMASRQWICDNGERAGDTGRAIVYELTEEGKWETRQRDNATKP